MKENEKVTNYLSIFQKKLKSFQTRAPIYFSFQSDQLNVYIQEVDSLDIHKIPIDYTVPVMTFISQIRDYLRENLYPKMEETIIEEREPSIEEIQSEIDNSGKSFDEAFKSLKQRTKVNTYILDKVDINKNRAVILKTSEMEKPLVYKIDMPVVVFLKKFVRNYKSESDLFKNFMDHAELIERDFDD